MFTTVCRDMLVFLRFYHSHHKSAEVSRAKKSAATTCQQREVLAQLAPLFRTVEFTTEQMRHRHVGNSDTSTRTSPAELLPQDES